MLRTIEALTYHGENSLDSARASYNLATVLVKGSQERDVEEARRAALVERAALLTLEACSVAVAAGEPDEGGDLVAGVLALMADDPYEDVVVPVRQRLRDAYLEATGEEWEEVGEDDGAQEDDDE